MSDDLIDADDSYSEFHVYGKYIGTAIKSIYGDSNSFGDGEYDTNYVLTDISDNPDDCKYMIPNNFVSLEIKSPTLGILVTHDGIRAKMAIYSNMILGLLLNPDIEYDTHTNAFHGEFILGCEESMHGSIKMLFTRRQVEDIFKLNLD